METHLFGISVSGFLIRAMADLVWLAQKENKINCSGLEATTKTYLNVLEGIHLMRPKTDHAEKRRL